MKLKNLIILLTVLAVFGGCKTDNNQQSSVPDSPAVTTTTPEDTVPTTETDTPETTPVVQPTNPTVATAPPTKPEAPTPTTPPSKPDTPKQPTQPVIPDNSAPKTLPIKYAAISTTGIQFFNGDTWANSAYEKRAGKSEYMVKDEIHVLDQFGKSTKIVYAPVVGDLIKKTSFGYVLCYVMTPQESQALGAQARIYSKLYQYKNGTWSEFNHWYLQQWTCSKIVETKSGEVVVFDSLGGRHSITSSNAIHASNDSGVLVHSMDVQNLTAQINTGTADKFIRFTRNYFISQTEWQELNGVFYSALGYEYSDANGLSEFSNAMQAFRTSPYPVQMLNAEAPTLIGAGFDSVNNVIYWIECNTGWLIENRLATNQLVYTRRLYIGEGTRSYGIALAKTLKPIIESGNIYFNFSGQLMKLDFVTNSVSVVLAQDSYLLPF